MDDGPGSSGQHPGVGREGPGERGFLFFRDGVIHGVSELEVTRGIEIKVLRLLDDQAHVGAVK